MQPLHRPGADDSPYAAAYARHWAPVIGPMASPLLEALSLGAAHRVLDLGCGTGQLLPRLRAAAPNASVIGVDCSEEAVRFARKTLSYPLAVMDARALALRPETFDVVLLAFVLFQVPDPPTGLREARRVLREGGTVGLVVWGERNVSPGKTFWREELDACGAAPDPKESADLAQTAMMDTPQKLTRLLQAAEFSRSRVWSQRFKHRWTTEELIALRLKSDQPSRRRMSKLSPAVQESCRARLMKRLTQLTPDELVYMPEVLFAVADRAR